jgi:hypothetical protein
VEPQGVLYRPALIGQVEVRYQNRKINLDYSQKLCVVLSDIQGNRADWDEFISQPFNARDLDNLAPLPGARYAGLPEWLSTTRQVSNLQKDFLDWVSRFAVCHFLVNESLKMAASPGETQDEFAERCAQVAREEMIAEQQKLDLSINPKLQSLQAKIERQKGLVEQYGDKVSHLRTERFGAGAEYFFGLFGKRKRSINTPLIKNRMVNQAKNQQEMARQALNDLQNQQQSLLEEQEEGYQAIQEKWDKILADIRETSIQPSRRDIYLELFGVGWAPYYLLGVEGKILEARAF